MTREEKVRIIQLLFGEIFDKGNIEIIDEIIHKDYDRQIETIDGSTSQYIINPEFKQKGREGFRNWVKNSVRASIENDVLEVKHDIEKIVIERDTAAINYFLNWKQKKIAKDLTPIQINKPVEFRMSGAHFVQFKDNKILNLKPIWDTLTLALNLGSAILDQEESKKFKDYVLKLKEMGVLPV
ncbi:MAG: ester cyclase [Candidatus Heimdallarchaeota archaeon]|nr:ester cyclase [Candidatus Heimdallarchaeota archaeon]